MRRRAGVATLILLLVAGVVAVGLGLVRWEQSASLAATQLLEQRSTPADAGADAFTRRDLPKANAGKTGRMYVGGRPHAERRAYLKFAVEGPSAKRQIVQATVYAYVLAGRSA